jgi:phenylpropionate dioxygenase-like ring-hydroxylating dioxygenase large terminal subunit
MTAPVDWTALGRRMVDQLNSREPDQASAMRQDSAAFYLAAQRFTDEQQRIFRDLPIFAAASAQVPAAGDYLALELGGIPIALVRGRDGVIRAFRNTCRHRGAQLLDGCGSGLRAIVCPYHAWSYKTTGELAGVPYRQGFPDVDEKTHSLAEVQCAEAHGLIFVQINDSAPMNLDAFLGDLSSELAAFGWHAWDLANPATTEVAANWKLTMDTYGECYHCSVLHRDTLPGVVGNLAALDFYGPHIRQVFVDRSLREFAELPEDQWRPSAIKNRSTVVYLVFPNLVLATSSGGLQVMTVRSSNSVDRTTVHQVQLLSPDLSANTRQRLEGFLQASWEQVVCSQDFPVIEGVWRSLTCGSIDQLTFGRNEAALQHLHEAWDAFTYGAAAAGSDR